MEWGERGRGTEKEPKTKDKKKVLEKPTELLRGGSPPPIKGVERS